MIVTSSRSSGCAVVVLLHVQHAGSLASTVESQPPVAEPQPAGPVVRSSVNVLGPTEWSHGATTAAAFAAVGPAEIAVTRPNATSAARTVAAASHLVRCPLTRKP